MPNSEKVKIVLSTGEPAGIGPDLALLLTDKINKSEDFPFQLIIVGDKNLLLERAQRLNLVTPFTDTNEDSNVEVLHIPCPEPVEPGILNGANAAYVLAIIDTCIELCETNKAQAMVTCPIQKSILIEAGFDIQGHTEYLAEKTHANKVVMMLASKELRVALATTHLPLQDVSKHINETNLEQCIQVLHHDLITKFGITQPNIYVCGLNPHAGEDGHLGREEKEIIEPCLQNLRAQGIKLTGPLPADTLFTEKHLSQADAVLAMYHDQGLPVLKYQSFGRAVNITLGLPIIRTSVDHGTALDLAGTGKINSGSLETALELAHELAMKSKN